MKATLLLGALVLFLFGCSDPKKPNVENFTRGVTAYLAARGDLCLGKNTWPLDVTDRDAAQGQRDGVQMPVLERLGLVSSTEAMVEVKTEEGVTSEKGRRYVLTDAGRHYYVVRETPGRDGNVGHQGDFCPVKLSLDKVVGWELDADAEHAQRAVVTYQYRVSASPDWLKNPDVLRVFPAVAHVLAGARQAPLKEGFALTDAGWVANDLRPTTPAAAATGDKVARQQ